MARRRIRSIKPEFFGDEKVISLDRDERYTMVGLVSLADDRGRLRDRPLEIVGAIYPEEKVSPNQLRKWLLAIVKIELALRYEVQAHSYLWIPGFMQHQVVEKPTESELPPHPEDPLAGVPVVEAYKEISQKRRGKLPDTSEKSRGDIGESSIPSRASISISTSISPKAPTSSVAAASDLTATVGEVCDILAAVTTWHVEPVAVENAIGMYPNIDPIQAARLAVTWAADPSWDMNSAGATFRAAARKIAGEDADDATKGGRKQRRKRGADLLREAMETA